ncbi:MULTISPECIES: STAS domain-containing protein [Actinosynnema]|uniref:STAS domain-containing protein n=1 Tax=Actinosynnema TaxID=40566 RepID=UPI0020A2EBD4|nr:STAS domain-containing protein [Actinosynnema pretiosum]MCP2099488.1 anti-anti-sigma factor [Actinosynnema pretiosum]
MRDLDEEMSVHSRECGGAVVLKVSGEVDQLTVEPLHRELLAALARVRPPEPVVVDLTEVGFFGSAGLNELVTGHLQAELLGTRLAVVARHREVLRPLAISGLDEQLDVHPTLQAALGA